MSLPWGASTWSLLQLLTEGGLNYLVDSATPHAYKGYKFNLSLVAHSYKPDCFRGYLNQMSSVFPSTLFMDPWTPTEIWKVAAKLHPQLSSSLVSWLAANSPCTCPTVSCRPPARHALVGVAPGPGLSLSSAASRSRSASMLLVASHGRCFTTHANLTEQLLHCQL